MRILLIEDELEMANWLARALKQSNISVEHAHNAALATTLLQDGSFDVVVLDLRMPGLSGVEVLKRIRHGWPELPVIMLSGHGSDQDLETCMNLGAALYHKKPLDIDMLLESIRTVTQGKPPLR